MLQIPESYVSRGTLELDHPLPICRRSLRARVSTGLFQFLLPSPPGILVFTRIQSLALAPCVLQSFACLLASHAHSCLFGLDRVLGDITSWAKASCAPLR